MPTSQWDEISPVPTVTANQATEAAVLYIAINPEDPSAQNGWSKNIPPVDEEQQPMPSYIKAETVFQFSGPELPAALVVNPDVAKAKVSLTWFFNIELILAWKVDVYYNDGRVYCVIVAADSKEGHTSILFVKNKVLNVISSADLQVYLTNPSEPRVFVKNPGTLNERYGNLPIPSILIDNGIISAPSFGWVSSNMSKGVLCDAKVQRTRTTAAANLTGSLQSSSSIIFHPTDSTGADQQALNEFFFCNYLHDFYYCLGFGVGDGDFSTNDFVQAFAYPFSVQGTANMSTPPDGQNPRMNMGTIGARSTALDADVVFHEYTHGVSNRLVGRRFNNNALDDPQSGMMGEGWSDYFALTIQNSMVSLERTTTGNWVTNSLQGIRSHPYDASYPNNYSHIANGTIYEVHDGGEIWCATLMHMTRLIVSKLTQKKGYEISWLAVIDGLKLTVPNPSFIDARNAIHAALKGILQQNLISQAEYDIAENARKEAFAKFGMGKNAKSPNGRLFGIVSDNTLED